MAQADVAVSVPALVSPSSSLGDVGMAVKTYPIRSRYTGIISDYAIWDGVMSWEGRAFMACPVCGIGLAAPLDRPMVHAECVVAVRESKGEERC